MTPYIAVNGFGCGGWTVLGWHLSIINWSSIIILMTMVVVVGEVIVLFLCQFFPQVLLCHWVVVELCLYPIFELAVA